MLNHIEKKSECRFSEQAVSYLYGETSAADKSNFETHLINCAQCADDLAGFGMIRSSILDWKAEKFDSLETPSFVVPQLESAQKARISEESVSWFDKFSRLFQLKPALAGLAILILATAAFYFSINVSNQNNIVADAVPISKEPVISPTAEITENKPQIVLEQSIKTTVSQNQAAKISPKNKPEKIIKPKTVEIKKPVEVKHVADKSTMAINENFEKPKKSAFSRNQTIPNLADTDDDEDTTVRLADLFDELDTK